MNRKSAISAYDSFDAVLNHKLPALSSLFSYVLIVSSEVSAEASHCVVRRLFIWL